jgi:hypothetical protein
VSNSVAGRSRDDALRARWRSQSEVQGDLVHEDGRPIHMVKLTAHTPTLFGGSDRTLLTKVSASDGAAAARESTMAYVMASADARRPSPGSPRRGASRMGTPSVARFYPDGTDVGEDAPAQQVSSQERTHCLTPRPSPSACTYRGIPNPVISAMLDGMGLPMLA